MFAAGYLFSGGRILPAVLAIAVSAVVEIRLNHLLIKKYREDL